MSDSYDVIVIGAGQGGTPLVRTLARAGKRTALAERRHLGGSCVNFGCTPSKAAIASARVAHMVQRAPEFGIDVAGMKVDFPRVLTRAARLAADSRHSLDESLEGSDNPLLLRGHARLAGRDGGLFNISVDGTPLRAAQVVLDTGTRSAVPPIEGIADIDPITSENWLENRALPESLLVIGGGYIGLEMAQFYRRMGSQVTIVEGSGQLLQREDADVAEALQQVMEQENVAVVLNARAQRFVPSAAGVDVTLDVGGAENGLSASRVFLALGRRPNTDDLGLETVGVETTEDGNVVVDERLRTSVPGLWAMGDIRGGPMFTHSSWDDYRIIESQMIGDGSLTCRRLVPYAVFTDPELGRVGLTEREAQEELGRVQVGRFDISRNGKAREIGETRGFIKIVTAMDSDRLLGAAVVATEAAELVHLYVELMNAGLPYTVMERAIHIHPTLAEAAQSALGTLH